VRAVTPTLAAAIEAADRTVDVDLRIDWDDNGYNTIDSSDTLDRTAVVAGWGTSTSGYTYSLAGSGGTVAASDWATTGTAGTMSLPAAPCYRFAYIPLAALDTPDADITVEWGCPAPTGGDLEPATIQLRMQGLSDYLMARTVLSPGGTVKVAVIRVVAAAETPLVDTTVVPGLAYNAAVHWYTRARVIGNRLQIMVWPATASRPTLWHATTHDDTWTSGTWGIRDGAGTGNTNTKPVTITVYSVAVETSPHDDLSRKLSTFDITRDLRGQLPDEVLVVEGISAATAEGHLTAGDTADERLNTVRWFSRTNPGSPIYGKARDSRDVQASARFRTDAGSELAPRLTGAVLRALPVNAGDRTAQLELIDGRDRFRLPITLPAVIADGPWDGTATIPTKPGLEASWVVSYVLARCGYPLAPPPRAECRLYMPMHGSAVPFVQAAFAGSPRAKWEPSTTDTNPQRVAFTDDAPFFLAADPGDGYIQLKATVNAVPADGWNTVGRATGIRIEHWIKRSGTEPVVDAVVTEVYNDAAPTQSRVKFYARTDGFLAVQVLNGASSYFVFSPATFSAGAWHFVGVHVDDAGGRITLRIDNTSYLATHASTTAGTLVSATVACDVKAYAPIAEVHVSMCTEATAWQPTVHTSGAAVDRLQNRALSGIYPDKPVEAWTTLQQVTAAEFGSARIDYNGLPTVWSAARRLEPDSLTVQRTLTARQHLMDLGYDDSRDMVRNLIRVPYVQYTTAGLVPVWSLTELVAVGPSETLTFNIKLERPLAGSITTLAGEAWTVSDGSGTGYGFNNIGEGGLRVFATVTSPTTVTATVTNIIGQTLWIVDTNGVPQLILSGTPITKVDTDPVEVSDATAIARRGGPGIGEASLDVDDNPWRQSAAFARGVAYQLLATLRDEQMVYTDIRIPGDPRLEDLDRVQIQDPDGLVLDTPVLIESIRDRFEPGSYEMELVARPARDQWILGASGTALGVAIIGGTNPGGTPPDPDPGSGGSGLDDEWDNMATTLLVAAVDAPADVIAAADYACDGVADDVQIQAAITASVANSKRVQLSMGTFQLAAMITLDGVDDVDAEHDIYLRGCGPSNTVLVAASGLTAGVAARKVAKVHVSDFRVEVGGATHGFASVATNTAGAGYRSFWLSTWKNLQVVGPFDGSHSGYAFHFESPFRSTFENLEAAGIGNGVRLFSSDNAFNPGDCTFQRCFMDTFGNNRFGYKIESTVSTGNMNQIELIMVEAIASGTGCTGIYLGGTGPVTHCKFHGVNLEQFDKIVEINNGIGNIIDMNYVELRNVTGLNAFTFGSGSSGNMISRVGLWYVPVNENMFSKAGGTATYPNIVKDVNFMGDGGVVSLGYTGPANTPGTDTLLRKRINNTGGTAAGSNVTQAPGAVNF
jgi:hypothetical protein